MTNRPILLLVVVLLAGAILGRLVAEIGPEPTPLIVRDTANSAAWELERATLKRQVELVTGERDGLGGLLDDARRRIEGLEARPPRTVTVFDTLIDVRADTVLLPGVTIRDRIIEVPVATPDSGMHRPELLEVPIPENCDESLLILAGGVICDPARLGHLILGVRAGAAAPIEGLRDPDLSGEIYVRWSPFFRSSSAFTVALRDDFRFEVSIESGVRIF